MTKSKVRTQAATIFLSAASYIRKYGWREEGMGERGQPRCSMGALDSANPEVEWDQNLSLLMYEALYEELDGISLTQYNHRYRSGEAVAKLYERVAKKVLA